MKKVGRRTKNPIPKSKATVLRSMPPTLYRSLSIRPVFTCMTFIGIRPRKVARANLESGTLRMGLEMLINQLGRSGVTRRNRR